MSTTGLPGGWLSESRGHNAASIAGCLPQKWSLICDIPFSLPQKSDRGQSNATRLDPCRKSGLGRGNHRILKFQRNNRVLNYNCNASEVAASLADCKP